MINGYDLSRNWFNFCFDNPEKIKPIHTSIYFFAIEHCNRLGWKDKFGFPSQMVMEAIGVKNWRTYSKGLNDIVDFGFIKMIETSKNQYSSNIIAIVKNTKAPTKALDKALSNHSTKQRRGTVSIDKQETNNKQTIKQYSDEVLQTYTTCLKYFPDDLHPKKNDSWLKTIDELNRLDGHSFEKILQVVKNTRENDFWKRNFLSLNKLRRNNKDGTQNFKVYSNQGSGAKTTRTNGKDFTEKKSRSDYGFNT